MAENIGYFDVYHEMFNPTQALCKQLECQTQCSEFLRATKFSSVFFLDIYFLSCKTLHKLEQKEVLLTVAPEEGLFTDKYILGRENNLLETRGHNETGGKLGSSVS